MPDPHLCALCYPGASGSRCARHADDPRAVLMTESVRVRPSTVRPSSVERATAPTRRPRIRLL